MQEASVGPKFHSQHVEPFMHWGCNRIRLNEQAFPATVDVNMAKQVTHTFEPGSSLSHPQSRQGSRSSSALSRRRPKSSGSQSATHVIPPWNTSFSDPKAYFQERKPKPDWPHEAAVSDVQSISFMTPSSDPMALTWPSFAPRTESEHRISTMTPSSSPMALTWSSFPSHTKIEEHA